MGANKTKLNHGDIVVMDNLTAHKSRTVIETIEQAGASVAFTPPYCPELNAIEKTWAKLKDFIRRLPTLTREAFDTAMCAAMATITADDLRGWVRHCRYAVC
jgi:transposase